MHASKPQLEGAGQRDSGHAPRVSAMVVRLVGDGVNPSAVRARVSMFRRSTAGTEQWPVGSRGHGALALAAKAVLVDLACRIPEVALHINHARSPHADPWFWPSSPRGHRRPAIGRRAFARAFASPGGAVRSPASPRISMRRSLPARRDDARGGRGSATGALRCRRHLGSNFNSRLSGPGPTGSLRVSPRTGHGVMPCGDRVAV